MVEGRAHQGVADIVTEGSHSGHFPDVGLHCKIFRGKRRSGCRPAFSVHHHVRRQGRTDGLHRFDVVDAHKVEAESVDVVFLHPVHAGNDHEAAHHFVVAGGLVAAGRAVGISAVLVQAVEVSGAHAAQGAAFCVIGVVVHHVHNDPEAGLMEGHDHLLHLPDTGFRIPRIGAVGALRGIIVLGIIAPVVLRIEGIGLVHRCIVERGQELHVCDSQFFKMVDAGGKPVRAHGALFGEGQEFAGMRRPGCGADGEIPVVHLVYDDVVHLRAHVIGPAFRVSCPHVDDGGPVPVEAHGLGEDAG